MGIFNMTIEENQQLRKMLQDMGYNIKSFKEGKLYWVARMNYPETLSVWDDKLKLVDSSFDNMTNIKYRTRLEGCGYNGAFKVKKMEKCTVEEVLNNIRKIEEQIGIKFKKEKLAMIKRDFE